MQECWGIGDEGGVDAIVDVSKFYCGVVEDAIVCCGNLPGMKMNNRRYEGEIELMLIRDQSFKGRRLFQKVKTVFLRQEQHR